MALRIHRAIYAPATLAIAGVEMNGSFLPEAEFKPATWVGKPVTLGHPTDSSGFRAARDADAVGTIAHAWVEAGRLKATLKLDDKKLPSRVRRLIENEAPLDVSTGYFSRDEQEGDALVNRDVIPDHLALLPDEDGACTWADGCGLRAQTRGRRSLRVNNCCTSCGIIKEASNMLDYVDQLRLNNRNYRSQTLIRQPNGSYIDVNDLAAFHAQARGQDRDPRQVIADLISSDASPFTPEDESSLRSLSTTTLMSLADQFLGDPGEVLADPEDPMVKAMTAHLNIREELRTQGIRAVDLRKPQRPRKGHDAKPRDKDNSPYTPEDERLADPEDEAIAAMTNHLRVREEVHGTRNKRARSRAA